MEVLVWLVFFFAAAVGMTHIMVDSPLLQSWKDWFALKRDAAAKDRDAEEDPKKKESHDKRFKRWAFLVYMSYCYQCQGSHVGFWLGLAANPMLVHGWLAWLGCGLLAGLGTAFLAPLGAALINYLDVARASK